MLLAEYDYDTDIAVQRKEAFNDGFSAGEERGITIGRNEGIAIGEERGRNEGISLGEHKKAVETAKNMRFRNIPIDVISECTGLSIEVIQDLADK